MVPQKEERVGRVQVGKESGSGEKKEPSIRSSVHYQRIDDASHSLFVADHGIRIPADGWLGHIRHPV